MIFYYIFYSCVCVWMAYKNAEWANPKDKWKIKHWFNGAIHLTAASIVAVFYAWYHFIGILCLARIVFDISMNIFRHFNPFHISPEVKRYSSLKEAISKGKVIDYIEYKIFGNSGLIPKAIYLTVLILIWSL